MLDMSAGGIRRCPAGLGRFWTGLDNFGQKLHGFRPISVELRLTQINQTWSNSSSRHDDFTRESSSIRMFGLSLIRLASRAQGHVRRRSTWQRLFRTFVGTTRRAL